MKKKCIIIEDQLPAQRILKKYIQDIPDLDLLASYTDALSAFKILQQQSIDLLFLDINLPKISGLNFLRTLQAPPKVIITTAYPEYAVEGFELDVADYLLKPFAFERFLKAVSKVLLREQNSPTATTTNEETYVFIKADKTIYRINFMEILYIKSDGDFVHLITNERKYLLTQTLKYWKSILPPQYFLQIHKSYIVALSKIISIRGNEIQLPETKLPIGRSFRTKLLARIARNSI